MEFEYIYVDEDSYQTLNLYLALMDKSACVFIIGVCARAISTEISCSRDMKYPTMWHFDMNRLRRVSAASL